MSITMISKIPASQRLEVTGKTTVDIDGVKEIKVVAVFDDEDYKSVYNYHTQLVITTDSGDEIEIWLSAEDADSLTFKPDQESEIVPAGTLTPKVYDGEVEDEQS